MHAFPSFTAIVASIRHADSKANPALILHVGADLACTIGTWCLMQYVVVCRETYIKADVSESPNDRNDRAIRVATAWYMRRAPTMPIIMLSNDVDNRQKAAIEGIKALSVHVRPSSS